MKEGGVLFAEHAQNILLMSCLEAEMEGKHSRAELVGRQSQVMYTALLHCYYPLLITQSSYAVIRRTDQMQVVCAQTTYQQCILLSHVCSD
jgi:hypothetical protein